MNTLDGMSLLASGRTADVYCRGDEQVLKLFRPGVALGQVEKEGRKASVAHTMGLPTPAVLGILRVGDRLGLLFEKAQGPSMLEQLLSAPDVGPQMAHLLADLHKGIHARRPEKELPAQKDVLAASISRCIELSGGQLSTKERSALFHRLVRLPEGDSLCHGDFHPGNVIIAGSGPMIIDWLDATRGNPLADVARTSLILAEVAQGDGVPGLSAEAIEEYRQIYVQQYLQDDAKSRSQYEQWLPIMAAARLSETNAPTRQWLVQQVRAGF